MKKNEQAKIESYDAIIAKALVNNDFETMYELLDERIVLKKEQEAHAFKGIA